MKISGRGKEICGAGLLCFLSLAAGAARFDVAEGKIGAYRFVNEGAAGLDVILLPPVCGLLVVPNH